MLVLLLLLTACGVTGPGRLKQVPVGTWGGEENAGLLVTETTAHAHIGCTLGDVQGPIPLDETGHFDVAATYNIDAFPVDRGIRHPARFSGNTDGSTLTLLVRLTDTGQTFGPVGLDAGPAASNAGLPHLPLAWGPARDAKRLRGASRAAPIAPGDSAPNDTNPMGVLDPEALETQGLDRPLGLRCCSRVFYGFALVPQASSLPARRSVQMLHAPRSGRAAVPW